MIDNMKDTEKVTCNIYRGDATMFQLWLQLELMNNFTSYRPGE